MTSREKDPNEGELLAAIDRVIHEPARLLIVSHLYVVAEADFVFLERQTGLTGGNLSSHLRKLEEAGYVSVAKEFVNRVPRTILALTQEGRVAFDRYRRTMNGVLGAERPSQ